MSYFLFLDDERMPKSVTWVGLPAANWVIVRNYEEFCNIINTKGIPIFVTYDHDLGPEAYQEGHTKKFLSFDYSNIQEKTGYDCAKFLIENCLDNNADHPNFAVHSMNPVGVENIASLINSYNFFRKQV
jgi:hypothetical protein